MAGDTSRAREARAKLVVIGVLQGWGFDSVCGEGIFESVQGG